MNIDDMRAIVRDIHVDGYVLTVNYDEPKNYLQAEYYERDVDHPALPPVLQKTRKWVLSKFMTKSEVVQTAFKCILTSAEHRVREAFTYKGQRVFGPHFDVEALVELARAGKHDVRESPVEKGAI